jgi:aspartyl-tRNA(Asn)/glutamyl-tRNA(Gln) amidotransferase subunit C
MSQALTRRDVETIAALAQLALSETEIELFRHQLSAILAFARTIGRVDTTNVPPTAHVLTGAQRLRPDETRPSLSQAEALANAPDPAPGPGLFKVPRTIAG